MVITASEIPAAEQMQRRAATMARRDQSWVTNAELFWANRGLLARVTVIACALSAMVAFLLPKQYESTTRIMPPEQSAGSTAMLAALLGRAQTPGSGLASLANGLLGGRSNGALFVSLLRSGTVSGRMIERFHLQSVYGKRYLEDTAKKLTRKTAISEDAKSGVITITVEDRDRARARDMAQAYVEELNALVAEVDASAAHRERVFIEQRLKEVSRDLDHAEQELSEFSTRNGAIDIKEQTRAMVDAGARLEGQLVASESELNSLEEIYGSENVRVRAAEARVSSLRRELDRESNGAGGTDDASSYPALRQLPALAVPWTDLYRHVRIEETVDEMLSAQYETARIEEARSLPTVRVIDQAGWPEKKSSPHRTIIVLASTAAGFLASSLFLLMRRWWCALEENDGRKRLGREMAAPLLAAAARVRTGAGKLENA
jgi:capsule polysaccharide export protein KpsE/RkpR